MFQLKYWDRKHLRFIGITLSLLACCILIGFLIGPLIYIGFWCAQVMIEAMPRLVLIGLFLLIDVFVVRPLDALYTVIVHSNYINMEF